MVERAVYMRRRNRDEARRAKQAGTFGDDAHRHRSTFAVTSGGDCLLLVAEHEAHAILRMVIEVGRSYPGCAVRPVSTKPSRAKVLWLPVSSTRV